MVVTHISENTGLVTIKAQMVQLRVVQLLLSGKTVVEIVQRVNTRLGVEYLNSSDVIVLARQFAMNLQSVVGPIKYINDHDVPEKSTVH